MNLDLDFSPVSLSYVGALRGIQPRRPGESFSYAVINGADVEQLICLAASNPEGRFYSLVAGAADKTEGENRARARQVNNVTFLEGRLEDYLAKTEKDPSLLPPLHYLCCDERKKGLSSSERAALFALAAKWLQPGGLFAYGYRAYDQDDGALRFLVQECAPEMDDGQAKEFLQEIKKLGAFYFRNHPQAASKLEQAIGQNMPDQFFAGCGGLAVRSGSIDTIVALQPRGFTYAGDAHVAMNYIELSAPADAHQLIIECRDNPLYEPVKDFALNRQERCDVWCHHPLSMTGDAAALFGSFVYGITAPRADVPCQVKTEGKPVDLSAPLFTKLIDLMTLVPVSIGDFLAHTDGKGFTPTEVVGAIQILVACGIAQPMRGRYRSETKADLSQPRLTGAFNKHLERIMVTGAPVWLASPMAGGAVAVSPRDALVMQALNRVGLANSVAALLPELQRLARDPASAARVMDTAEPTPEIACNMIKDTVSQSIVQWYAYGLLSAA